MFYIFADTQAFRGEAFGFETSKALLALANAVKDGRVTVLLTTITEREIQRRLTTEIETALQAVKKSVKDNYMLRSVRVVDLESVRNLDKADAVKNALAQWDKYRASLAPKVIDFDSIKPSEIMDAHFAAEAPFSVKKPNEFRDAFVLGALREWAETEDQQVLVISGDGDLEGACDGHRLVHVPNLLGAIAKSRDDVTLEQLARGELAKQQEVLKEQLMERFPEIPIAIEEDPDADAEDHEILSLDFDADDFVLVECRDGHLLISGSVTISFKFNATIADYANGSMDEGDWVYLPYNTYTITTNVEAQVAIRMPFGGAPPNPG
jgi:hypothetical protein